MGREDLRGDKPPRTDTPEGRGHRRTQELSDRYERYLRRGLLASVLFHVILFLIFGGRGTPPVPFSAAGPRAGDDRAAAAGGGAVQSVQLREVRPQEVPRPEIPLPMPVEFEVDPIESEIEPVAFSDLEGMLGDQRGPEQGAGIEGGEGRGDGGTASEGRFRVIPPSPRGMILPPSNRPRSVRGKEITIYVFVTERGRVVPDSTLLRPASGDRSFDEELRRQAAEWVFEPARRGGQRIAEWFRYTVSM